MDSNLTKLVEDIFNRYVILDTGFQALQAYLSSLKCNQNKAIKTLMIMKDIADENILSKIIDKPNVDILVEKMAERFNIRNQKINANKQKKITSFNDVIVKPINTFEDELLKCQFILENSIIYIDSTTSNKNIFSEPDEKTYMFQKHYKLIRKFLLESSKYKKSDIIVDLGNLQGTEGKVLLFGMLIKKSSNNYLLSDLNTKINLDISKNKNWGLGYFTPGCCIICNGYHKNGRINVNKISHPDYIWNYETFEEKYENDYFGAITKAFKGKNKNNKSGNSSKSSKNFGANLQNDIQFNNLPITMMNLFNHDISDNKILYPKTIDIKSRVAKGEELIKEYFYEKEKIEKLFNESKNLLKNQFFLVLSNVDLSNNNVISSIGELISKYSNNNVLLPFMIIFMGNFFKDQSFNNFEKIQDGFEQLSKILLQNKKLVDSTYFVFMPGPDDFCLFNGFPRHPFIPIIIEKMKEKIPNIINASNPCRFSFFGKEIVIIRDDLNKKLSRNSINDENEEDEKIQENNDQTEMYIETILKQGSLIPVSINISPRIWHLAHKMIIAPLPDILILGDVTGKFSKKISEKVEMNNDDEDVDMEKNMETKEIVVVNPGDFSKDTLFACINPIKMESNIYSLK